MRTRFGKVLLSLLVMGVLLLLVTCKKGLKNEYEKQQNNSASNTNQLKAGEQFDFATFSPVTVRFEPIAGDVRSGVFKVFAPDGTILFQKLQKVAEPLEVQIIVPNSFAFLKVSFAEQNRDITIINRLVVFQLQ